MVSKGIHGSSSATLWRFCPKGTQFIDLMSQEKFEKPSSSTFNKMSNTTYKIISLAQGNPGALTVCASLARANRSDLLDKLESAGIVGPSIWVLYKDICHENIGNLIGELSQDSASYITKLRKLGY